jgi:broad specificity phosphatase PhoE
MAADEALWTLLKGGGQVVIMRHAATVPNVPDTLGAGGCASQRNLSEEGREDARRIGAAFRARGITPRGDNFTVAGRLKPSDVSAN